MQFNSDSSKQAHEIIFFRKLVLNNLSYPPVEFNNNAIARCSHQKHLLVAADSNLNFNTHIDKKK